jgi:hypothetical protein
MLEAVERLALESLRHADEPGYLQERLSPDRYKKVQGMYKRAATMAGI